MLVTSDLEGNLFACTCLNCGFEWESPEFKALYKEMDDSIKDFKREDILKTKRKTI